MFANESKKAACGNGASSFGICDYSDTDYEAFWSDHNREYEDTVERIAIKQLIQGMKGTCLDIGAGYGRLVNEYAPLCSHVLLTDYAENMVSMAKIRVQNMGLNNVECAKANLYEIGKMNHHFDNAICVRVIHHVENVPAFFEQVNMILHDGGTFILEYANKKNLLEIFRFLLRKPNIGPFDYKPSKRKTNIYYNYHPNYIRDLLLQNGFVIEKELTVSIFRNNYMKKVFGWKRLSRMERWLQSPLAKFHPGPSVFIRARKVRDCQLEREVGHN